MARASKAKARAKTKAKPPKAKAKPTKAKAKANTPTKAKAQAKSSKPTKPASEPPAGIPFPFIGAERDPDGAGIGGEEESYGVNAVGHNVAAYVAGNVLVPGLCREADAVSA